MLRCRKGCFGSQQVPSDAQLGIAPYQQTSWEVKRLGSLLSVFVPYELARQLLEELTGVHISDSSLWNWVQQAGQQAKLMWEERLTAMAAGEEVPKEPMSEEFQSLMMVLSADGVMVPFPPHIGTAKGKTRWQEVLIGGNSAFKIPQNRYRQAL